MYPIFILFLSVMVFASNESQQSPYIPGAYLNSCIIVDHDHEIAIGPPVERRGDKQWWLLAAYALDVILLFVIAFVFRLHMLRKKRRPDSNSPSSTNSDEIRLAAAMRTIIPSIKVTKAQPESI